MSTDSIRERPIIFSAPMVRALLEGSKTQTRRLVNPDRFYGFANDDPRIARQCPYGQPGDRLWVREAWLQPSPPETEPNAVCIDYRASLEPTGLACDRKYLDNVDDAIVASAQSIWDADTRNARSGWRPSIHMPRWASRINLEITEVRAERLQDITEEDAWAEGIWTWLERSGGGFVTGKRAYAALWEQINGEGSWAANPWVWAVSFKVVTP